MPNKPIALTQDELKNISDSTLIHIRLFIKSPHMTTQDTASLATKVLKEIRPQYSSIEHVVMMQTLQQMREDERE